MTKLVSILLSVLFFVSVAMAQVQRPILTKDVPTRIDVVSGVTADAAGELRAALALFSGDVTMASGADLVFTGSGNVVLNSGDINGLRNINVPTGGQTDIAYSNGSNAVSVIDTLGSLTLSVPSLGAGTFPSVKITGGTSLGGSGGPVFISSGNPHLTLQPNSAGPGTIYLGRGASAPTFIPVAITALFNSTGSEIVLGDLDLNTNDLIFDDSVGTGIRFDSGPLAVELNGGNLLFRPDGGSIDFEANVLTDVGDPIAAQDAATKNYVDAGDAVLTNFVATQTGGVSTTSSTYVVMTGMTVTPSAGSYYCSFSGSGAGTSTGANQQYALFDNGVVVAESERDMNFNGGAQSTGYQTAAHTQAIIAVPGAQAIDVRFLTNAGTFSVNESSLVCLKVAN